MKTFLALALLSTAAAARTAFEASVESGVKAAAAEARKAAAIKRPKPAPAPREVKDGVIPRFQQRRFPLPADGKCGLKAFFVLDYEIRDGVKNRSLPPEELRDYTIMLSNFGVWAFDAIYPKTAQGLIACYVAAVPFFQQTLAGDAVYTAALFGGLALAERWIPVLREPSLAAAT